MVRKKRGVKRKVTEKKVPQHVQIHYFKKYLTLDWKEIYLLLILWFLAIVLHHVYQLVFRIPEKILVLFYEWIIPIFFLTALIYTLYNRKKK